MRKIEGYQCDNCQFIHETEDRAVLCEQSHKDRKSGAVIQSMKFRNPAGKYGTDLSFSKRAPESIVIKFSDEYGDFGRYVLEHYGYKGV